MRSSIPRLLGTMAAVVLGAVAPAQAAQHAYHIGQVFFAQGPPADPSDPNSLSEPVIFITLVGQANNQGAFRGMFLCSGDPAIQPGQPGRQCFQFDANLGQAQTQGKSLLFASPSYLKIMAAQKLPMPDFMLEGPAIDPTKPFFNPVKDLIRFLPTDNRTTEVAIENLPQDGKTAQGPFNTRAGAPPNMPVCVVNAPTNFAGATGTIDLTAFAPPPVDMDGDGIAVQDNCPSVPNRDQLDTDGDFVGDVCDSCRLISNPRIAPSPGQSTIGGQIDDDADGFGNECDAKFTPGTIVDSLDAALFMNALGKQVTDRTCGVSGNESCRAFDVFPGGVTIDEQDLQAFQSMIGKEVGPAGDRVQLQDCWGAACPGFNDQP